MAKSAKNSTVSPGPTARPARARGNDVPIDGETDTAGAKATTSTAKTTTSKTSKAKTSTTVASGAKTPKAKASKTPKIKASKTKTPKAKTPKTTRAKASTSMSATAEVPAQRSAAARNASPKKISKGTPSTAKTPKARPSTAGTAQTALTTAGATAATRGTHTGDPKAPARATPISADAPAHAVASASSAMPFSVALRAGDGFDLSTCDPRSTPGFDGSKRDGADLMATTADEISTLQERLFAQAKAGGMQRVLLIVQGMDTSGKGGIMRHVIGLVDPQGVDITAFKAPTAQERSHPFLWRIRPHLPTPGQIGVFDRSHYEDVLIARVRSLVPASTWSRRYGQINTFERTATRDGVTIVKVMLHISKTEQKARLEQRLDRPDKHWKFNPGDIDERGLWDDYQGAYQAVLERTSTDHAPWYVVPADRKWFARLAVQQILLEHLRALDPQWPAAAFDVDEQRHRLAQS